VATTIVFAALMHVLPARAASPATVAEFDSEIRPLLAYYCADCHKKGKDVPFLAARTLAEIEPYRGTWRSVVSQLRNRTMPPIEEEQPSEQERIRVATWLDQALRETARDLPEFAGAVTARRLNRLEYDNTIRDLFGLELNFSETFPTDGGGGEGFDNNGETLFLPAILMERYLEAAQQILNHAIITPPFERRFLPGEFVSAEGIPLSAGILKESTEAFVSIGILVAGDYAVRVAAEAVGETPVSMILKVDGIAAHRFEAPPGAPWPEATLLHLPRGVHTLSLLANGGATRLSQLELIDKAPPPSAAKRAAHARIFGDDFTAGRTVATPANRRAEAARLLGAFTRRAYRRPVAADELERIMALYDRSAARAEPFEESVKLALKAVLVSPHFLFRVENEPSTPGVHRVSPHELASRLSYFLWASMPDDELARLADTGRLAEPTVLEAQAKRLLADERARSFIEDFTGQWLGTREVGASVAFTRSTFKGVYTSDLADDLRAEPVQLMQHIVMGNRSLIELISADYAFLTQRIAQHYGIEGVEGREFRRVSITDGRRGGVMGLGAVHMITAHPDRTSPVLRGAWVLETLLGTPVPPPPPDIPPLTVVAKQNKNASVREQLSTHRESESCRACHDVIDPIGFGLENYDLLGRWRDTENGKPIDASATMPSGETFNGPGELKQVLLERKGEFARHITTKMLGYALGRSLEDRDDGTIENIVAELERADYRSRALIRAIVLSTPFRHRQGGEARALPPKQPPKKKLIPAAKPS
jgi:hypothetical protein